MTDLTETPATVETPDVEELIYRPGVYKVTIYPEVAKALLQRNTNNRPEKKRAIGLYADEMRQGKWHMTNQGLGIDRNGVLTDGQNRLLACVEAGVPFETLLATGLDPESKDVVDTGVKRTLADTLRMRGKTNVAAVAAGAAVRVRYEHLAKQGIPYQSVSLASLRMGHEAMIQFIEEHPALDDQASKAWILRKAFPRVPMSVFVGFGSMAQEVDPDDLAEFYNAIVTGANLAATDPRLALRNYLTRLSGGGRSTTNALFVLAAYVKAWNEWRHGQERELMTVRDNEPFPMIDAMDKADRKAWQRRRRDARLRAAAAAD